jgi:hypothetical protein
MHFLSLFSCKGAGLLVFPQIARAEIISSLRLAVKAQSKLGDALLLTSAKSQTEQAPSGALVSVASVFTSCCIGLSVRGTTRTRLP